MNVNKRIKAVGLWIGALGLALSVCSGCSSDPDTPLGAEFIEGGLIGSEPGEVFQDTVFVSSGDSSFTTSAVLPNSTTLTIGRNGGNKMSVLVRIDFSSAGIDTTRSVERADLRLALSGNSPQDTLGARFYELLSPYTEGESFPVLDTASTPIPDSTLINVERTLQLFPVTYSLPPMLVEEWIKGTTPHNGIAVVLNDTTTTKQLLFGAIEGEETIRPRIRVVFTDGGEPTNYPAIADGTFVEELDPPLELRLSDGLTRRLFVPVNIDSINIITNALLHAAKLVLNIVPSSSVGGDRAVTLYVPNSTVIGDPEILTGMDIAGSIINPESGRLEIPVRATLEDFLSEGGSGHGFVLRFSLEGTEIRRTDFYSSGASLNLRPRLELTYSRAPEFPR
jgi:hypothetical protein